MFVIVAQIKFLHPFGSTECMRVMTPANPSQNSLHNATRSSRALIAAEMARAAEICGRGGEWSEIFEELDFTATYGHYIVITASAKTEHDQVGGETVHVGFCGHPIIVLGKLFP